MAIWRSTWGSLRGGWRTHGPGAQQSGAAFELSDPDDPYAATGAEAALKLSAVHACVSLRAEILGSLPIHLRDKNKKQVTDHPLYSVLHTSPNWDMTSPEFFSQQTAHVDMFGNGVSIIERGYGKKVVALTPVHPDDCTFERNKSGSRKKWKIGKDEVSDEDVLHFRGFSMDSDWGAARIDIGRQIIQAQLTANRSAIMAFRQGLKVGGFFTVEKNLDAPQLKDFKERLDTYGQTKNAGKWMALLAGMKPVAGTEFAVKPSDTQLLESRQFGIEEICRLFNVPPQLIGQTNKASSWASSIENINLYFLMYSLQPTIVRMERRINKKLLTPTEIAAGLEAKFSVQGLLRADMKAQSEMFASALQNGYFSANDVLDLLDRPHIKGGDEYRVQLNMGATGGDPAKQPAKLTKPAEEDDE